jgi:hypothetical protein
MPVSALQSLPTKDLAHHFLTSRKGKDSLVWSDNNYTVYAFSATDWSEKYTVYDGTDDEVRGHAVY